MKFLIVGVCGTGIAVLGMFLNCLAFCVLRSLVFSVSSPLIYLFTLSILDFLFMWIYILAMSVQIYFDYYSNLQLYHLWNFYLPYVMTVGKVNQTATTYLLIAATTERMMDVGGCFFHAELRNSHRVAIIVGVILFSVAFRLVCFWELNIVEWTECSGFARFSLEQHDFSLTQSYQVYNFYIVNIVHVFLPFGFLLFANVSIVRNVRNAIGNRTGVFKRESVWKCANERENLRTATNILITVITIYLLANVLNVVVTIIEYTNRDFLELNPQFYTFSVDCIGLMQISTSACRLIICIIWSERLRGKLLKLLGKRGTLRLHNEENSLLATTLCLLTMKSANSTSPLTQNSQMSPRNSLGSPLLCLRNSLSYDRANLVSPKTPDIWMKT